jgi:2-polyprenyl-6-methoxyphenol hydroxylase-like FAD-dependent oxidoreductase
MKTTITASSLPFNGPAHHHAVVIGGSMAGLSVARVLTDYFPRVTVVERDTPPQATLFRTGAPQARHPHVLLKGGELALEQLFPGLRQELLRQGALLLNAGQDLALNVFGQWRQCYPSAIEVIACSRPLLESVLYRHLATHPRVAFIHESEVVGLCTDERRTHVTGVQLRARGDRALQAGAVLAADLVVDASGRGSHAPQWLQALGYPLPAETSINAHAGYATRIYQRPTDFRPGWRLLASLPAAPAQTRGGLISPMEGDRWHVTLIGMAGDYPPADEGAFLAFARSLPDQQLYLAIKGAQPLNDISGFRTTDNRLRRYDRLPRYLEGFLVCGDSVAALNPVYGQGMSVAALSALAIDRCLRAQRRIHPDGDLRGLAQRAQIQIGKVGAGPWQMATDEDRRWIATEAAEPQPLAARLLQQYASQVLRTMLTDVTVAEAFTRVQQMIAPPMLFFRPDIVVRVLVDYLRRRPLLASIVDTRAAADGRAGD